VLWVFECFKTAKRGELGEAGQMPFKELDEKTLTDTALYDKFAVYLSQEYQTAKDGFLALGTACNSISTLIQEARALHEAKGLAETKLFFTCVDPLCLMPCNMA